MSISLPCAWPLAHDPTIRSGKENYVKTLETRELLLQRDKCAAAIRGLNDCLAYARLDPPIIKGLRESLDYETARLEKLDAAIISA